MADYNQLKNAAILTPTTTTDLGSDANRYSNVYMSGNIVMSNGVTVTSTNAVSPRIISLTFPGTVTAVDVAGGESVSITGSGFSNIGGNPSVLIGSTSALSVTYISSTNISFVTPVLSAGTYTVYVINSDGATATYAPGISFSGTPTWTTSAGSLVSVSSAGSVNTSVAATGDAPITYALKAGSSLPTGLSLNTSTGAITGTMPTFSIATTYNFTLTAKDGQNQTTDRSFSVAGVVEPTSIQYIIVAGGGSGGGWQYTSGGDYGFAGGGGGAGGYRSSITNESSGGGASAESAIADYPGAVFTVVIGAGAAQGAGAQESIGNNGSSSYIANSSISTYYGSFNGTSDYLATASSSQLDFGTGDFTIECWVNSTIVGNNYPTFLANVTGWSAGASGHRFNNTGQPYKFSFHLNGAGDPFISSTNTFVPNTYYHYALTRSGNTWKMYINGSLEATGTYSGSYNLGLGGTRIGNSAWDGVNGYFKGNVSNLRVVKGVAVYTGNFTVPSGPLTATQSAGTNITAITGTQTSLLTLQNASIVDNSTFGATITTNGSVTTSTTKEPFALRSSAGGGGGGGDNSGSRPGGSGGGGGDTRGSPVAGQGYIGGVPYSNWTNFGGGGGGGAGGAGGNVSGPGGAGGIGVKTGIFTSFTGTASIASNTTLTITAVSAGTITVGTQVTGTGIPAGAFIVSLGTGTGGTGTYIMSAAATATNTGVAITSTGRYHAGGGGGGGWVGATGAGGAGGGGGDNPSVNGATNTGGGGSNYLSTGGSGIVVIRYSTTSSPLASTTGSPTYEIVNGYRIYRFTQSGSFTL
jgi:hypothetical protein